MSIIQHLEIVELCIVALKFSYNCQLDNSLCAWVCLQLKQENSVRSHTWRRCFLQATTPKNPLTSTKLLQSMTVVKAHTRTKEAKLSVWNQTWSSPCVDRSVKEIQQWKCGVLTMHLRTTGNSWKSAVVINGWKLVPVQGLHMHVTTGYIYTWALLKVERWCNKLWTQSLPCTINSVYYFWCAVVLYSSLQVDFSSSTPPSGTCMRSTATAMPGLAGKTLAGGCGLCLVHALLLKVVGMPLLSRVCCNGALLYSILATCSRWSKPEM